MAVARHMVFKASGFVGQRQHNKMQSLGFFEEFGVYFPPSRGSRLEAGILLLVIEGVLHRPRERELLI